MERILVSMEARQGAWEAWSRAIWLAKRIDAKVYALLVLPPSCADGGGDPGECLASPVRKRLELAIEVAKSENVPIDYFVSEGNYEEEVVRFVDQNRITLLIIEPPQRETRHPDRGPAPIRSLGHRTNCRVEVVSLRKDQPIRPKERQSV